MSAFDQAPDVRGCPAAQHGTVSARLYRGHVVGLATRRPVPDPVNPAMNGHQRAAFEAASDLLGTQSRSQELLSRDHPLGAAREVRNDLVY
jgi:hypothetical protein